MVEVDYMRIKLLEWHPNWNIERFSNEEIAAIYQKERSITVDMIIQSFQ